MTWVCCQSSAEQSSTELETLAHEKKGCAAGVPLAVVSANKLTLASRSEQSFSNNGKIASEPSALAVGATGENAECGEPAPEEYGAKAFDRLASMRSDTDYRQLGPAGRAASGPSLADSAGDRSSGGTSQRDVEYPSALPSAAPETTPERFMELWSSARFHRAVDEQDLGPRILVPPDADPLIEHLLDFASHLSTVFDTMRMEIPEPMDENRDKQDAPFTSSAGGASVVSITPLRRPQTKLNCAPLSDREWFAAKGFEDVSPKEHTSNIGAGCHAWLKIEPARTYLSMDLIDLPFSVEELLPVLSEFEQFPVWFPFLQSAQVLHEFPGTENHIRMGRACMKLPILSIESIMVVLLEDRLRDCGCIGVYVFSPPEEITMSREGGPWMGSIVPGMPSSKFKIRMPFAWARTCIFPTSRTTTRIRAELAVVNVVPPINWVFRQSAREIMKRVPGMMKKMVAESRTNSIGQAAAKRPEFYGQWKSRLDAYYANAKMPP
mmetsp:Transcript_27374/g.63179  ORF Transcript_27374/g.63179 Transcript_27374/m.63179 type:complete len:494 (-) Transcript_27374:81-1562(-)